MAYSRWATIDELKSKLTKINYDLKIEKSGIPMTFDEDNLYIKDDNAHTMVIGSTGSGKTQTTTLPLLRLAIMAEESFVIHDVKGEIYNTLKEDLKDYNTIVINLDNPTESNHFNPLSLPYELYKKGRKDDAIDLLERIGYYFCCSEKINPNVDPFWTNSAISLFTGLSLYMFDKLDEKDINIGKLMELALNPEKVAEEVRKYDASSLVYINFSNILSAPEETKGSIISVFTQYMKGYVSRELLLKMLSTTDFNINNIQKERTAIFIISNNKSVSRRLIPLIIDECYYAATLNNDSKHRLNIVIDDFDNLIPINDFNNMLSLARSYNIKFNIYIKSLLELKNAYGKEDTAMLKIAFGNIIYLLANDIETLEEISKLCGNTQAENGVEPLITVEELKLLNTFEAIILMPRVYPVRTKLVPDFQIKWK